MSKVFLYAHGGSGNHGCEAIVRSTIQILERDDVILISSSPEEDVRYGTDKICRILKDTSAKLNKKSFDFLKAYAALKIKKDYIPMERLRYKETFAHLGRGDIAISIGGDNYCYANVNEYVMLHDMLKGRGAKTVLWGCSVEPEVAARQEIAADLARYDLITARETITYKTLQSINPNTVLVADPAFVLDQQKTELPNNFIPGNTVGINLSPMVIKNETKPGMTWENYITLLDYILDQTDMNVALIPHVVWEENDDRCPHSRLYERYKHTNRIAFIEDHNCMELKYIISQCRFFVGARTHSTIAAYSTCVPTVVAGYSVKSKGIARDLFGTEDNYVVPVQALDDPTQMLNAFVWLQAREMQIKHRLQHVLPALMNTARAAAIELRKLDVNNQ